MSRPRHERWRAVQRRLPRRTAVRTLLVLAADLGLDGLACKLGAGSTAARFVAVVLLSLAMLHAYLVHHECVHHAVFIRSRYNEWLGELLGFVILYPYRPRKRSHLQHHVWAGHRERDPATARAIARMRTMRAGSRRLLALAWRTGVPIFALNERLALWRDLFRTTRGWRKRAALAAHLFGYLTIVSWMGGAGLLDIYVSALCLLLLGEEMLNLPHHLHAPFTERALAVWEQDSVTHSCAAVPIWSQWVLLHFNLHRAHHVFPNQPWYRLPALETMLAVEEPATTVTSELRWSLSQRQRAFESVFESYLCESVRTRSELKARMMRGDRAR